MSPSAIEARIVAVSALRPLGLHPLPRVGANQPRSGSSHLWCSVCALHPGPGVVLNPVLVLNRCVPRDPQLPPGFEDVDPELLAALMAAAAHLEVHGEFVLARGDAEAGLVDLTDEDVERWTRWFEVDARVRRK